MGKIIALWLAVVLAGCASAGSSFLMDDARKVTVGMTEAQVVAIIGKPNSVATAGDQQVWRWVHASSSVFAGAAIRHVSFPFRDGRVTAVPNLSAL